MDRSNPRRIDAPSTGLAATTLGPEDPLYPRTLDLLWNENRLPFLSVLGNRELLRCSPVGILCSVRCPGEVILQTYEIATALRADRFVVVGGFHSPMERQCLETFLARRVPVIVCLARALPPIRLPRIWRTALAEGRLCVLSVCGRRTRRVTRTLADRRNRVVAAIADLLFVPFASPGGAVDELLKVVRETGKRIVRLDEAQVVFSIHRAAPVDLIEWFGGIQAEEGKLEEQDPD